MKPILLLLPGLSGTPQLMRWITPYLSSHFTLRLIHLPESQTPSDQNYNTLATYIYEKHLSHEHVPCWLLGESFSGPLAITLAHQYPQQVAGVILAATFAACPNHLAQKLQKLLPLLLRWKFANRWAGLLFLCGLHTFKLPQDLRNAIQAELNTTSIPTLTERLTSVMTCNVSTYLPLSQPVLYLQARQDWLVHQQALDLLKKRQPEIQIKSFNSPHLLLQIRPQEAAQIICNFIHSHTTTNTTTLP